MGLVPSPFVKIQVAVPAEHADAVRKALGDAGAGKQGNYAYSSGSYRAWGRFLPLPGAEPAIGEVGQLEKVEEEVIQTICHEDLVPAVIAAIKKVHPYEEPAIDILPRFEVK